jgi:carboxypeptidase C (cathepsin A)
VKFDYNWNKFANVLYIEAPVGVGFSYSTNPSGSDYDCTDDTAADDNLHALETFFEAYVLLECCVSVH